MPSQIRRAPAPDAEPSHLPPPPPRAATFTDVQAARTRIRRFLSYYRPHLPLLAADLACAVFVAITALALPLCAGPSPSASRAWRAGTPRWRRSTPWAG